MALDDSRNFRIDLLRGIAIFLVLILHFHLSYALTDSPLNVLLSKAAIKAVAVNGNYGVTMFFAISGYLITSTAINRYGSLGNIDLRSFYIFRLSRILPGHHRTCRYLAQHGPVAARFPFLKIRSD